MEAIKLFDDVLASWQNESVADIELDARYNTVFNAYLSSKDGENEILTFRDISYFDFETNMGNLHNALLELGIKQIAITETSTALMSYLWYLTNNGWRIDGMKMANTPSKQGDRHRQIPAIILTYERKLVVTIANVSELDELVESYKKNWPNEAYGHDVIMEWLNGQLNTLIDNGEIDKPQDPNPHCQVPVGDNFDRVYCFNVIRHNIYNGIHHIHLILTGTMK